MRACVRGRETETETETDRETDRDRERKLETRKLYFTMIVV